MNIIHMKYAVEVARLGSISKASETLNMAQPNISRAIKDLEFDLGITIFDRSAKGMVLTPEGKQFVDSAQNILNQLNDLKHHYHNGVTAKKKFSVSAPRAAYIAQAFAVLSRSFDINTYEAVLDETDTYNTINKVITADCKLGIIRYDEAADSYFKEMLEKNNLHFEDITSFRYVVIASKESVLASKETVCKSDLSDLIQITHKSPYEATLLMSDGGNPDMRMQSERCIYVLDPAAQLEILSDNPETFMWISPAPDNLLKRHGLIQFELPDCGRKVYKDVIIYSKKHKLTDFDKSFIEILKDLSNKI
ncbi:MAG: LysR family transcriptional regulator [Clostridia bacterium]|nr:LysR family transcriptional regulator [Clostridia bacterium]